jgi:hypothetical protein
MKTYVGCSVSGDIHLPQKHCCATLSIWYSIQRHVAQQHVQNTLLSFLCNSDKANAPQYYVICTLPNLFSDTTNKMQRYTIIFILCQCCTCFRRFSAHHQELKNCINSIGYYQAFLLRAASGRQRN